MHINLGITSFLILLLVICPSTAYSSDEIKDMTDTKMTSSLIPLYSVPPLTGDYTFDLENVKSIRFVSRDFSEYLQTFTYIDTIKSYPYTTKQEHAHYNTLQENLNFDLLEQIDNSGIEIKIGEENVSVVASSLASFFKNQIIISGQNQNEYLFNNNYSDFITLLYSLQHDLNTSKDYTSMIKAKQKIIDLIAKNKIDEGILSSYGKINFGKSLASIIDKNEIQLDDNIKDYTIIRIKFFPNIMINRDRQIEQVIFSVSSQQKCFSLGMFPSIESEKIYIEENARFPEIFVETPLAGVGIGSIFDIKKSYTHYQPIIIPFGISTSDLAWEMTQHSARNGSHEFIALFACAPNISKLDIKTTALVSHKNRSDISNMFFRPKSFSHDFIYSFLIVDN